MAVCTSTIIEASGVRSPIFAQISRKVIDSVPRGEAAPQAAAPPALPRSHKGGTSRFVTQTTVTRTPNQHAWAGRNAEWFASPGIVLPAGTYHIVPSDIGAWAFDFLAPTPGEGFAKLFGQ